MLKICCLLLFIKASCYPDNENPIFRLKHHRTENEQNTVTSSYAQEINEIFNPAIHRAKRQQPPLNAGSCSVPPVTADKTYTLKCPENCGSFKSNFCMINYTCNPGYATHYEDQLVSFCVDGTWYPRIRNCIRTCDILQPVNVNIRCFYKNATIDCNGIPFAGTVVLPKCPIHYYFSRALDSNEIVCKSNGEWSRELAECIPDCGRISRKVKPLIAYGTPAALGEFPWHVAIYRLKIYICGGTIISPNLVISAAHCFYDEKNHRKENSQFYEIAVSKITSNYSNSDNPETKIYKVGRILFNNHNKYIGYRGKYSSDVALLWIPETIIFSDSVLPACIYLNDIDRFNPEKPILGTLAGWGKDENKNINTYLKLANLSFIDYNECNDLTSNFQAQNPLSFDKFCARKPGEPAPDEGDSGGGFFFVDENTHLYYIRGIVSMKQEVRTDWTLTQFTDLAFHINWIRTTYNNAAKKLIKPEENPSTIANGSTQTVNATSPAPPPKNTPSTTTILPPSKLDPYTIAQRKCEQYAGARYINKTIPSIVPGDPGINIRELDCVTTAPLIVHGIPARLKEFPHMALIGFGEDLEEVTWDCGGTLISERYVLSSGHCRHDESKYSNGLAKWARVGELVINTKEDGNFDKDYRIIEHIVHPDFKSPATENDIALFKLESEVQFTPFVRPICLYNKEILDPDLINKATITGWGVKQVGDFTSDSLQKATVNILKNDECKTRYANETFLLRKGYDAQSMLCAGDKLFGNDTCTGDSGGPIQVPLKTMTCMWAQIGITSIGSPFCDGSPAVYTRIKYFLPWIQKIVWP